MRLWDLLLVHLRLVGLRDVQWFSSILSSYVFQAIFGLRLEPSNV